MEFSHRTEEMILLGTNQPTSSKGPPGIAIRCHIMMVIDKMGGTHACNRRGDCKVDMYASIQYIKIAHIGIRGG